jgi:hypothetical protein
MNNWGKESTQGTQAFLEIELNDFVFHFLIGLYSPPTGGSGFSTFPYRMVASAS